MSPEQAHELSEIKRAADILGELPPGPLGTQEPVYRAYTILAREIERVETKLSETAPTLPRDIGQSPAECQQVG